MGAGRVEGTASFGPARASFSNQRSSAGTTTDRTRPRARFPVETFARALVERASHRSCHRRTRARASGNVRKRLALVSREGLALTRRLPIPA